MSAKSLLAAAIAVAVIFQACTTEVVVPEGRIQGPPNVRTFPSPRDAVFKALLHVLRHEQLIPLVVADETQGIFSSEAFVDEGPPKIRHRLSGRVLQDGSTAIVTVYDQRQILQEETWRTVPTDYAIERRILDRLAARLAIRP